MPAIGGYDYIIEMLLDVGPINLTWSDLRSWDKLTGMKANAWEFRTLKRLANIYTANSKIYNGSKDISPFVQESTGTKTQTSIRDTIRKPLSKGIK